MKLERYNEYKNLSLRLAEYAEHTIECNSRITPMRWSPGCDIVYGIQGKCNCGLDELQAEVKGIIE